MACSGDDLFLAPLVRLAVYFGERATEITVERISYQESLEEILPDPNSSTDGSPVIRHLIW